MRQRLILILVNVVIFAGLLAVLEFGARSYQRRRFGPKSLTPAVRMDRWTAWRNTPGFASAAVQHDGQGFRHSAEVTIAKPANTVRIFFIGGSAAYGFDGLYPQLDPDWHRMKNSELVDAYLEAKLTQHHPERRWEVINGSVVEYRMHQELVLLYAQVLQYHPDLVVFMDGHNDMSGLMSAPDEPYNPFTSTPHQLEFDTMTRPESLRSLVYINSQWLRTNSVLFDILYRKSVDRLLETAFGPGIDPKEPVKSPVHFTDLSPAAQIAATRSLANAGYYATAVKRLRTALEQEHIPVLFSLQPELLTNPKPLTSVEAKFADYTRQVGRRLNTYLWEQLRPVIAREMNEASRRDHFTFVDLDEAFRDVREKAFTDYCHLTPLGNERIAEALYKAMDPELIARLTGEHPANPRH
jgi:lysophospholipase L1-like esterase